MTVRLYELKAGVLLIVSDEGARATLGTRAPRIGDLAHDYAEYLRALADMVDEHAEHVEREGKALAARGSVGVGGEELIASRGART